MLIGKLVASTGIEPVSGASETLILSIVLRGQFNVIMWKFENVLMHPDFQIISKKPEREDNCFQS